VVRLDIQVVDGIAYDKWNYVPYTGEVVEYYCTGCKKYEGLYSGGKLYQITGWFDTGVMMYQYTFRNNNRLGN
jgi:antitoxin component YwqK of YwqJK toxin-antitoxin module